MSTEGGIEEVPIPIGEFTIDLRRRGVYRGPERVQLPPKSFEVLLFLVRQRGRVVSKRELLTAIWGEEYKDQNTVEQAVRQIRLSLADDKECPRFIQTFARQGYCFIEREAAGALASLTITEHSHSVREQSSSSPEPDRVPELLATNQNGVRDSPEETRGRTRLALTFPKKYFFLAIGMFVIAGILLLTIFRPARPGLPASVKFSGDSIRALDAEGRVLWTYPFGGQLIFGETGIDVRRLGDLVKIADLFGNGGREVVVVAPVRRGPNLQDFPRIEVDCLSSSGTLLWSYVPREAFRFGNNEMKDLWTLFDLLVSHNGRNLIYAAFDQAEWGNSFVVQIDAVTGHGTVRFVNTGSLHALNELQIAGANYLIAGGFNNEYDGGSLAVIDERKLFAASTQTEGTRHKCVSCPPGDPDYYFVFPRSELNQHRKLYENAILGMFVNGGEIEIQKREIDDWTKSFYILRATPAFHVVSLRFDSNYEMLHRELEKKGALHHSLADCPERLHPAPVRVWTPSDGWKELEVKSVR